MNWMREPVATNTRKIPVFKDGDIVGYVDRKDRRRPVVRMISPMGEGSFGYAFFTREAAYHGTTVGREVQVKEVREGGLSLVVKGERWRSMSALAISFRWRGRQWAIGFHSAFPFVRVVYED